MERVSVRIFRVVKPVEQARVVIEGEPGELMTKLLDLEGSISTLDWKDLGTQIGDTKEIFRIEVFADDGDNAAWGNFQDIREGNHCV